MIGGFRKSFLEFYPDKRHQILKAFILNYDRIFLFLRKYIVTIVNSQLINPLFIHVVEREEVSKIRT